MSWKCLICAACSALAVAREFTADCNRAVGVSATSLAGCRRARLFWGVFTSIRVTKPRIAGGVATRGRVADHMLRGVAVRVAEAPGQIGGVVKFFLLIG